MRFLTLSGALLLLGLVSAEEPSLECAMYSEACESLCILNRGGELAVPKCSMEATTCMCDGVDMSTFVNENAVVYINNLSENDLDTFLDSSYERYAAMAKESATKGAKAIAPVLSDLSKLEKIALKPGMMNTQGAIDASTKNLKFNLVLEDEKKDATATDEEEDEGDEDEGDEDEGDEDEGDEDEGDEDEGDEDEGDEDKGVEDKGVEDGGVEDDDKQDKNGDKKGSGDESKDTNENSPGAKPMTRIEDPFCQTFVTRCKDDCSASQPETSCALEGTNSGYLLACVCNGVDISASVYAQVKAENQIADI